MLEGVLNGEVRGRWQVAGRLRQRVGLVLSGVAALLALGVGWAPAASAHASLLFTTPTVGSSVAESPTSLMLIFDQRVTPSGRAVRVAGSDGAEQQVDSAVLGSGGSVMTAAVRGALRSGVYTVTWQVIAQDGDAVTGSYQFAVGPSAQGALSQGGLGSAATSGQVVTTALRWILFAALAMVIGEAVAVRWGRRHRPDAGRLPRQWTLPAVLAGLVAALGLVAVIVGDGSVLSAVTDPALGQLDSRPGVLALVEAGVFAAAGVVGWRLPRWDWVPVSGVVVAEGLRAHPQAFLAGWGALTTVAHLGAAMVWVGGLVYVVRCAVRWRSAPAASWAVLGSYARLAAWLFAVVVATGVVSALVVVPLSAVTSTGYGRWLLVKLGLVVAVSGCALAARWRLRRRQNSVPVRLLRAEAGVLVAVLGVTAVLGASAPPRQGGGALRLAPPATGPVVQVGARTGEIGVSVTASDGQVVLQLTAPGSDAPGADAGYRLSAALADPAGATRTLRVRGCGVGCFVAPIAWEKGASHLTVRVAADGWQGGTASVAVPWPAHPDPGALERVASVLRGTGAFTVYERVTSDTTRGLGTPHSLTPTGQRFLTSEPYSGGRAANVNTVPGPDGTTTLLLGYPAEKTQIELIVDADGRPQRETLTAPNHLVTRTFIYPESDEKS
ncbi:copper resistance CopC/CopD family protein [Streptomyces sp. DSM 41987]|uniref:copper resistance CopC/CopD family protein n=1 Tax=Streptomyces TaxID=1883 RepID=UPI001E334317|nr:copper resistance protein CopC [Streptomyces fildesensis]